MRPSLRATQFEKSRNIHAHRNCNGFARRKTHKAAAHAKSAEEIGSIAEAQSFMAKVQEMLTRHRLSMADLTDGAERDEAIDADIVLLRDLNISTRSLQPWLQHLATATSNSNGCRACYDPNRKAFMFIGRNVDRHVTVRLFLYVVALGDGLCSKEAKPVRARVRRLAVDTYGEQSLPYVTKLLRQWKDSFLGGYSYAIGKRLMEQNNAAVKEHATGAAIVLLKNDLARIDSFIAQTLNAVQSDIPNRKIAIQGAFSAGYLAGSNSSLTPGGELAS